MKKITISTKPTTKTENVSQQADSWVENREVTERNKRLTIDISESLHRAIKSQCAMRGTKISDEIRELLTEKYTNGTHK